MRRSELGGALAEVFTVPLDDSTYLVYAPLRSAAFVGNRKVVEVLSALKRGDALPDEAPGHLAALLRNLDIVGAGPESPPAFQCEGVPEPVSVTLFLTTACNLRCSYCYASAGSGGVRSMTLETAQRAIGYVAGNAVRHKTPHLEIRYHGGGEPTLNWPVLTGSFEFARRKCDESGLQLRASVATNGVLDDRRIEWIVAHLGGAGVSCDGLPEVHDECRRTPSGKGSSGKVIHTLRRFDEAGFSYGIRLTVTADHIARLADSVEFLSSEFRPQSIHIEPVYLLGRGADAASAETDQFVLAYREAAARAAANGRRVQFSGARVGTLTNHFCNASRDNFCVSADGNVTACFEAFGEDAPLAGDFFYGRPAADGQGYVYDMEVLARLRGQSVNNRAYCRDCFAKWSCGGDCYYKWLAGSGGGEFRGSSRCHVIRELTKDQILEKIADSGGLFWHQPQGRGGCGCLAGGCC
jgi:uncharacterized protein